MSNDLKLTAHMLINPFPTKIVGHTDRNRAYIDKGVSFQVPYASIITPSDKTVLYIYQSKYPWLDEWFEEVIQMTQIIDNEICIFLGLRSRQDNTIIGWTEDPSLTLPHNYPEAKCKQITYQHSI
jgi:hypothetical protein